MDPLDSNPINADEHCGFSQKGITHPSEKENGCANQNAQTNDCSTPCSLTKVVAQPQLKQETTEMQDEEEFWLSDEKPYFHCVMAKSHVRNQFQLVMPTKMHHLLPEKDVPVILTYGNKNWKMSYLGDRTHKRFDSKWKQFSVDNNLKIGDGCVFELLECTEALIKFRVQILSGDIPSELLDRIDGLSSKNPIVLE